MKYFRGLIVSLVVLVMLGGCSVEAPSIRPIGPDIEVVESPSNGVVSAPLPQDYTLQVVPWYSNPNTGSLEVGAYASPGKWWIGYDENKGMYPGARAEATVDIVNKTEEDIPFGLFLARGTYFKEGNLIAPIDTINNWVEITETQVDVSAGSSRGVLVVLEIPSNVSNDEAIFWYITRAGSEYLSKLRQGAINVLKERLGGKFVDKATTEMIVELVGESQGGKLLLALEPYGSVGQGLLDNSEDLSYLRNEGYIGKGDLLSDDWGFVVAIKDLRQRGMVQTQGGVKWLIRMR